MNGVISGTPTTAGNFNVTISATNSGGTGSATLALTVAQQQAPAITSSLSASGTVGVAFNYQITASNNNVQQLCEASGGTAIYCGLYNRPLPFSDRSAANYATGISNLNLNTASFQTEGFDLETIEQE